MDAQQMKNLEDVYKKWESKSGAGRYGSSRGSNDSSSETQANGSAGEAWRRNFGENRPPPSRHTTRTKSKRRFKPRREDFDFLKTTDKKFQVSPANVPAVYKRDRPFMGRGCQRCYPGSTEAFYDEKVPNRGMHNILNIAVYNKENLFRRTFCHIVFMWNRNVSHHFPRVNKSVINSARVQNCIANSVFQDSTNAPQGSTVEQIEVLDKARQKQVSALNKEANGIIANMAAVIYRKLIRLTGWFLLKLFGRLLDSIQIHKGQVHMLHRAVEENKPMVFLPLHKSHLDYVLVTFILLTCDIKAPHVAAGDNLQNMLLFSWLMHHLGGFFIKRKLDHCSGKDDLYKIVLHEYVQQILQEKQYLEVFIEGSRSRTGKAMVPKSGLLSVVVNSVLEGLVPDVLIVPVNISYEKLFETSYSRELLGDPKIPETFWSAVKGIWEVFGTRYGHVRVDFGQPFSLQEFSHSMDCSQVMQDFSSSMAARSSVTSTPMSSILRNLSDLSLADMGDDRCFLLTKALGYHVIYDAVQCSAVLSTNMLAFLLLHRHRKGATLQELKTSFDWLRREILTRGRDVGFSGKTTDVVEHALELMDSLVEITQCTNSDHDDTYTYILPRLCVPYVIDLVHYSNLVLSIFAIESVVACSIVVVAKENGIQVEDIEQGGTLPHSMIIEKAQDLCELLQREFIFVPPCILLETGLTETLDKFITSEIIKSTDQSKGPTTRNEEWAQKFAVSTWDDDEDEEDLYDIPDPEYKLTTSRVELARLEFLQSLLSPLIESYWVASCGLLWMLGQDFTEGEFLTALNVCAKERVTEDVTMFPESCSLEPLRNAVRIFKETVVIEIKESTPKQSFLHLTDHYNSEEAIFEHIQSINQFRM